VNSGIRFSYGQTCACAGDTTSSARTAMRFDSFIGARGYLKHETAVNGAQ